MLLRAMMRAIPRYVPHRPSRNAWQNPSIRQIHYGRCFFEYAMIPDQPTFHRRGGAPPPSQAPLPRLFHYWLHVSCFSFDLSILSSLLITQMAFLLELCSAIEIGFLQHTWQDIMLASAYTAERYAAFRFSAFTYARVWQCHKEDASKIFAVRARCDEISAPLRLY